MGERKPTEARREPVQSQSLQHHSCTLFESCLAPLCPMDPVSLKGIWYPDEEICRSRSQGGQPWIRAQRRIAKVAGHGAGYFTFEMLSRLVLIRKGITGLDPDLAEEAQLRAWFHKRPVRGERCADSQAARARHLRKFSFREKGNRKGAGVGLQKGRDGAS